MLSFEGCGCLTAPQWGLLWAVAQSLSYPSGKKLTESWAQVSKAEAFLSLLDTQAEMIASFCVIVILRRLTWDERAPRTSKVQPSAELITDMQTLTARWISWLHGFPLTSSCTAQDPASLAPHVWYCHLHPCKMDCSGPAGMLSGLGPCNRAPNRITCTWLHSCMVFPIVFSWVEVQNSYQPTLPGSFQLE